MIDYRHMKKGSIAMMIMLVLILSSFLVFIPGAQAEGSIEITDARGEKVFFNSPPKRIISFMASNTEILFYIGQGDRVVGVDDYSNHPSEVKNLPKVGNAYQVDYEKIVNLSADVVVISKNNMNMIEPLEEYGQKVLVTGTSTLEDIYEDMEMLGKMCGIPEKAENMASGLKNEMEETTSLTEDIPYSARPDVLYVTSTYQGIWTSGNDTFQNTLLCNAGMDNIAADKSGWITISEEKIIDENPEVIVAVNSTREAVLEMTEKESWSQISAVKDEDIYFVDDDIVSRPGPRVIEAQERLVKITREFFKPKIFDVRVEEITNSTATIMWNTDTSSSSIINYSTSSTSLCYTIKNDSLVKEHSIKLTNLSSNTSYYFEVSSTSRLDDITSKDNGSSYYRFRTLNGAFLSNEDESTGSGEDSPAPGMILLIALTISAAVIWEQKFDDYP